MAIHYYRYKLLTLIGFGIVLSAFQSSNHSVESSNLVYKSKKDSSGTPQHFGWGRTPTKAEIERLDIDVRPDGKGLPAGAGLASKGKVIFETKCVACHGVGGIGGINGSLVTNKNPADKKKEKTIGNYWPYATTVFDYVRRAMPFNAPGSLTNEEVYHLTAYLLNANEIIDEKYVINAQTLPKVIMPAQKLYVPDDRKGGAEIK